MTEILHSFSANSSEDTMYIGIGIGIFILCLILFGISIKKKLQLLLMFSGFVGLLALGATVFSYWNKATKLPNVELFAEGLTSPQGTVLFEKVRKIDLLNQEQFSKFPIHSAGRKMVVDTTRMIYIEEYSGKVHVISAFNYPIDDIYESLRPLVQAFKERNKPE